MKNYLYKKSNYEVYHHFSGLSTIAEESVVYHHFSGLSFMAEVNFWRPLKTVISCDLFIIKSAVALSM